MNNHISNVYEAEGLLCDVCGKDLLVNPQMALVQITTNYDDSKIVSVHKCCKGECDRSLRKGLNEKGYRDGWKDLCDFLNPYLYIKHMTAVFNRMNDNKGFENEEAFESYKSILLNTYPYVVRDMTDKEKEDAVTDNQISFL